MPCRSIERATAFLSALTVRVPPSKRDAASIPCERSPCGARFGGKQAQRYHAAVTTTLHIERPQPAGGVSSPARSNANRQTAGKMPLWRHACKVVAICNLAYN